MQREIFTYSLIKYTHSRLLNESVVVGIIFYFPILNKIVIRAPNKFGRIKSLYSDFNDKVLKSCLNILNVKSNDYNKHLLNVPEYINDFGLFLDKNFLIKDYSSLEFVKPNNVVLYADQDKILNDYTSLYLSEYDKDPPSTVEKHNEDYIVKKIGFEFSKHLELKKYFQENVKIGNESTSLNFDYVWQNGSTNLIRCISFDLASPNFINDKAVNNFGHLSLLKKQADENNYRFDLLLTKPQDENLLTAYEKAKKILSETQVSKSIIEEERFIEYANEAAYTILNH